MAINGSGISGILSSLSASIDEFPQDLFNIRGPRDLRAGQLVDAGDEVLGESKGGFCLHPTSVLSVHNDRQNDVETASSIFDVTERLSSRLLHALLRNYGRLNRSRAEHLVADQVLA